MSMRSAVNRPKDRAQRINEMKRMKLSVERNQTRYWSRSGKRTLD